MLKGKLTSDQKALINAQKKLNAAIKKAIKPIAKNIVSAMKERVPVKTGALKRSLAEKEFSKGAKVGIVAGVKSQYTYKGKQPNLYAKKVNAKTDFLSVRDEKKFKDAIIDEVKKLL